MSFRTPICCPLLNLWAYVSRYCCSTRTFAKSTPAKSVSANSDNNKFIVYCNSKITENGRKGDLAAADSVFHRMPVKTVVSWTALLTAYAENGRLSDARSVFEEMPERNIAAWNAMITAYVRTLKIREALRLFEKMPHKNSVSYAVMVTGFINAGMVQEAEKLYSNMPDSSRDPVASNALISGYLKMGQLPNAVRVFDGMSTRDVVSWSTVLDGYCKAGRIEEARGLFDRMPERNVVSWTAMLCGYVKSGMWDHGLELFSRMRMENFLNINSFTLTVILDGCANRGRLEEGIQVHALVILMGFEADVFLSNSLINMYFRLGYVADARKIFEPMDHKDLVSWNTVINGYVQNDELEKALELFVQMPKRNAVSWTSIVVGFSNRGRMEESVHIFEQMPEKDDVAWTAIVSGFLGNGQYKQAITWFIHMLRDNVKPNSHTLSSVSSAAGAMALLDLGVHIHVYVVKMGFELEISVQNSLLSMYAKCGNVDGAYQIFSSINEPNLVSVNSMITGLAQHGRGTEAVKLFREMQEKGYEPNKVTFLGVLSACVHAGLVNEGLDFFKSMRLLYKIEPQPDHYVCMVDLLGRSGKLKEAMALVTSMPFEPHSAVWGALLGASQIHQDVSLAKLAALNLLRLEPKNGTPYAVLSKMYAEIGRAGKEEEVRKIKQLKGARKKPGSSWIIVG